MEPGTPYRLDACFRIDEPGVAAVFLRLSWLEDPNGYGASVFHDDLSGWPGPSESEQCLSLGSAHAPCPAESVRYGVIATGNTAAVHVTSLALTIDAAATPAACPTPAPGPSPTATPGPATTATATPTPRPPDGPADGTPPDADAQEPALFQALANGGFEQLRADATPYGWRKVGGAMSTSTTVRAEGTRSASLTSATESTKWLFQTVAVDGGAFYRLRAQGLIPGSGIREILLRISWYASAEGAGNQLDTADSEVLDSTPSGFVEMDTGPVRAPDEARSAKVRLLVRPASAARATAYFDDVRFGETSLRPAAAADSTGGPASMGSSTRARGSAYAGSSTGSSDVLPASAGPLTLANVKRESGEETPRPAGGGFPLWPALLAIVVPAAGLALMAIDELKRSRIDETDEPRL